MNKDQKQVLLSLAVMVGFKAVLYAGIIYSAKKYRELMREFDKQS